MSFSLPLGLGNGNNEIQPEDNLQVTQDMMSKLLVHGSMDLQTGRPFDLNMTKEEYIGTHCANCERAESTDVNLQQCSRCKSVVYCSKACQKADYSKHKFPCRKAAAVADEKKVRASKAISSKTKVSDNGTAASTPISEAATNAPCVQGSVNGPNCIKCGTGGKRNGLIPLSVGCGCKTFIHPTCQFELVMEHDKLRQRAGRDDSSFLTFVGANALWDTCHQCNEMMENPLLAAMAKLRYEHYCKARYSESDPRFIGALQGLANAQNDPANSQAEKEEAKRLNGKILRITKKLFDEGTADPNGMLLYYMLNSMANYGLSLALVGNDFDAATAKVEEAIESAKSHPKGTHLIPIFRNHLMTLITLKGLPSCPFSYISTSSKSEVADQQRIVDLGMETIADLEETEGRDSLPALQAMSQTAFSLQRMGKVDEALPIARDAYDRAMKTYGKDDCITESTASVLNNILRSIGLGKHPAATLTGLKSRPDLNGKNVDVVKVKNNGGNERYIVRLSASEGEFSVSVKNLRVANGTSVFPLDSIESIGKVEGILKDDSGSSVYRICLLNSQNYVQVAVDRIAIIT